jgi:hypothetical protein
MFYSSVQSAPDMDQEVDPIVGQALAAYEATFALHNEPIPECELSARHRAAFDAATAIGSEAEDQPAARKKIIDAICDWKEHHFSEFSVWTRIGDKQEGKKIRCFTVSEAVGGKYVEMVRRNWELIVERSSAAWDKV